MDSKDPKILEYRSRISSVFPVSLALFNISLNKTGSE